MHSFVANKSNVELLKGLYHFWRCRM